MKKVILAFAVVSVFAACNNSGTDTKAADSTAKAPVDSPAKAPVDTTVKVTVDSTVKVTVDTAKKAK
jgi:hypothetical protein